MPKTGLVFSRRYLEHDTGSHHPERAARLRAIEERFAGSGLAARMSCLEARPASPEEIETVHDAAYVERFRQACAAGLALIDTADCPICPASFEIAQLAVGGTVVAVEAVMAGVVRNAFVACRPPGHHAERNRAMGFCFFNNVAIAAERLRIDHGLKRIAIVDWDVHHGNGTQHHFEADPDVFFCSIHQHPDTLYPGTGYIWEKGHGPGVGTTLNVPLRPGSGDEAFRQAFEEQILPAVANFRPEFILISAGFDAHAADPLANLEVSTEGFRWMTRQTRALAESQCNGRLVSVLEGGYELEALADSVQVHVEELLS
ncbi:MAG TPA: histone deacetylase [Phycisphaerae bacterium]|jgi:acetoin utilization deacetylase AcuC-like enzyme|nr:histone deacetylase [Phycisphaerae bacterium]HOB76354.1 histone deacetylase [Phycisphaerae bacterium]HOJ55398.1 histone deacetylase [Phycisphaerae bacterium]HOL24946.1 histone deacetylase [Phycisphaerae bacterium]HPP20048.1 histone deacetylase [Phycisphaerae bacterium]